jgi:hypothetical protein
MASTPIVITAIKDKPVWWTLGLLRRVRGYEIYPPPTLTYKQIQSIADDYRADGYEVEVKW